MEGRYELHEELLQSFEGSWTGGGRVTEITSVLTKLEHRLFFWTSGHIIATD